MPFTRPYLVLLLVAATAVTGCNGGTSTSAGLASPASPTATGTSPGTDTSTPAPASDQDRIWLKEIHQGNLAEIQAGRLGERKGGSEEVKKIGTMLIKDHTELDKEVAATAERLGVNLPKNTSSEQKDTIAELRDSSRDDFDEVFLTAMRKSHEKAVEATKTEIEKGSSPEVKQLAEKALPALERHLQEIEKVPGAQTPGPDSGTPAPESS